MTKATNLRPVLAITEPARQGVEAAVEAGWTAVELAADVPDEVVARVRRAELEVAALRVHTGDEGPHLACVSAYVRAQALDRVTAALDRAAKVGAAVITVQPAAPRLGDGPAVVPEYAEALQLTYSALNSLSGSAALRGVAIGVDVAVDGFLLSPVEARELFERVRSPEIGACLDVWRAAQAGRPADWAATLRHRIVCVRMGGDASGCMKELAKALAEVRYAGPLVFAGDLAQRSAWLRGLGIPTSLRVD